jgi:hypothetical protein
MAEKVVSLEALNESIIMCFELFEKPIEVCLS